MYSLNDKSKAIKKIQKYLSNVGNRDIFVAPTGVYDENTRLSVIDFQGKNNINKSGVVDRITFESLYSEYVRIQERDIIRKKVNSFINFPILPGSFFSEMIHINNLLINLLEYYGIHHNLRENAFYSEETANAVQRLRGIYLLEDGNFIDERLYARMLSDYDSILSSGDFF